MGAFGIAGEKREGGGGKEKNGLCSGNLNTSFPSNLFFHQSAGFSPLSIVDFFLKLVCMRESILSISILLLFRLNSLAAT